LALTLKNLTLDDTRGKIKRAGWSIGTRRATRYFTLHFNGPPVKAFGNPVGEFAQLQFDATYHMRPGALGSKRGGDGIQYHGATLSNGRNVLLRDWNAMLWHCGVTEGNAYSIAWHVPIGGNQQPTQAQIKSVFEVVIPCVLGQYGIWYKGVRAHMEWKATNCPGVPLMRILSEYRNKWGLRK
jgi:hypothetical protein